MTDTTTTVNCPECGKEVNVNEIVMKNAERNLRREYEAKLETERTKIQETQALLVSKEALLKTKEGEMDKQIEDTLMTKLSEERKVLQKSIKIELEKEQGEAQKLLEEELEKKSHQLKDHNTTKAQLKRLQLEKDELATTIESDMQEKYNQTLKDKTKEIADSETAKSEKNLSEKTQIIEQLKRQLEDSQRKIEQGSMQVQGETQEVAIEQFLKETFALDEIEEIKKGARGGDCLQIINTRAHINCGSIYYESKRVKSFKAEWVDKLKQDMIEKGANIGVIVTETMPIDMKRAGKINGIWICTFDEFKGLCPILREALIMVDKAVASQENKGDKMGLLYHYLSGSEFALQVESIVEGFAQMQEDLNKEKRAMNKIWKTREKQIDKVQINTTNMYGSLKGILGKAIPTVETLELTNYEGEKV